MSETVPHAVYIHIVLTSWHPIKEELLIASLIACRVLEILLLVSCISSLPLVESVSIKVHLYTIIRLEMVEHILNVTHDT